MFYLYKFRLFTFSLYRLKSPTVKKVLRPFFIVQLLFSIATSAQTPQWNWAKGAGGTVNESVMGNYSTLNLDSAGNVYELVASNSSTISFGSFSFTNPRPATPSNSGQTLLYFVKYNPQGTVLWAKQYRNPPDGSVLPGPNSMFVRPDGTSYLHFAMVQDSIVIGGKVARNSAIDFFHPGYCIAQYDVNGNVERLTTHTDPYAGWQDIMPLVNNQMLAFTTTGKDTIGGIPLPAGSTLAILDSTGRALKVKSLGYDSNSIFNYQPVLNSRCIAINQRSIYLLMSPTIYTHYNKAVIPFDSAYVGTLLVKMDTALNFKWAKPIDSHFGALIATDESDNVYLPFTAVSRETISIDTITIPFPFRYLDHFYSYLGLFGLNGNGRAQWGDTILMQLQGAGALSSVCADRLGNSYLLAKYENPTLIGGDTLMNGSNFLLAKYDRTGNFKWVQTTENGVRLGFNYNCMAEDGHGNLYLNGSFSDPNYHLFFGKDSLVARTPINNYPLAPDVFLARLGNCNPTRPILTASAPLSWCGTDSVQLLSTSSNSYLWNTADTARSIIVNQAGIYSVYAIDSLGCYAKSKTDTVIAYPQPVTQASVKDPTCNGMINGRLSLHTGSATGDVHYSFAPPINDTLKLGAGTYSIIAVDSAGCTDTITVVVNEPTKLTVNVTYYSPANGKQGFAVPMATGGTKPYFYTSGGDFPPVGIDTFYGLDPGEYTIVAFDSMGCTATVNLTVPVATQVDVLLQTSLNFYPNPASNSFTIESNSSSGTIEVFDMNGKLLLSPVIQNTKTILNTQSLAAGIYVVSLKNDKGVSTKKIVVER